MAMWKTKEYRNVFAETGIGKEAVDNRLQEIIRFYFQGAEDESILPGRERYGVHHGYRESGRQNRGDVLWNDVMCAVR